MKLISFISRRLNTRLPYFSINTKLIRKQMNKGVQVSRETAVLRWYGVLRDNLVLSFGHRKDLNLRSLKIFTLAS